MSRKEINTTTINDKKMRTKDLIYAGAFGAIYIVLMLIIVMASGMIPILYIISPLTVGAICGTVYMLCVLKVRKFGVALILGLLFALTACISYWVSFVCAILIALVAEFLLYIGKYKSKKLFQASFVVFNLNMACPFLALLLMRDRFFEIATSYYGETYADSLAAVTPSWIYAVIFSLALAGGVIGALLSGKLIEKHFEKAGVVS